MTEKNQGGETPPIISRREMIKLLFGGGFLALALPAIALYGPVVKKFMEAGDFTGLMDAIWQRTIEVFQKSVDDGEITAEQATASFTPTVVEEARNTGVPDNVITDTIASTPVPTFTPAPTETERAPTPGRAEVDAVLNAENDAERTAAALVLAEYLNANTPTEVNVNLEDFGAPDGSILFWSGPSVPEYNSSHPIWVSSHTVSQEPDYSLVPDAVLPGMTNDAGENIVFIDGRPMVVPEVNIPGLGAMSMSEMAGMNQTSLKREVVDFMGGAQASENRLNYLNQTAGDRYALPVVMLENAEQTYRRSLQYGPLAGDNPGWQIPETKKTISNSPTNYTLMPLTDPESGKLFGWLRITQGIAEPKANVYSFSEGDSAPQMDYVTMGGSRVGRGETRPYGAEASDSFAILLPKRSASGDSEIIGSETVLEHGTGIGNNTDILGILAANNVDDMLNALKENKLFVTFPDIVLHED